MIVTVLWEDQSSSIRAGFGPHELLVSCPADELSIERNEIKNLVESNPRKGNGNVRASLKKDLKKLSNSGPVVAVLDRDKILDLWKKPGPPPADCWNEIDTRMKSDAPGEYCLLLIEQNIESLLEAACAALSQPVPEKKPNPNERDTVLNRAAWENLTVRADIRQRCPSFDRIVRRVTEAIRSWDR
ncbi:MAG: hypothetical protein F9K24_17970 [Leptonema illini]|uniref:DUF4276 family protein n=1 Tax=Leptonema illini TaxID=183 RepID=A0A833GYJ3_9LEPT|nr:MAG: hypothetical protein F9K24_17970 [Leptonema illini]